MPDNDSISPIDRHLPQRISSYPVPMVEVEPQGTGSALSFATFWHIIVKRLWTIVIATIVVLMATAVFTYKTQPVYKATASIMVETNYPQLQTLNEIYRQTPGEDSSFLTTQMQVLQSDSLAWSTMEKLGLDSAATLPVGAHIVAGQTAAQIIGARKVAAIEDFKAGLSIEPIRDSRLLAVSYESNNPEKAANIVNQLIQNYEDSNFQERDEFTRRASGGMEHKLEEMKTQVEKSQQALIDYERQNGIANLGDKGNIDDQRLEQLSKDFTTAESDVDQKESLYELAKGNEGQVGIIVQDDVLQRLEEKYNDLKASYADALTQYGPNHPKAVRFRDQLKQMQSLMDNAQKQAIEKLHNGYLAAVSRVKLLGDALAKEKGNVSVLNQRMIEHNILKRDFESNQQLYDSLLQRLKDATLSASLQVTNVHVIDPATIPVTPIRPNRRRNLAAGLMFGLILGVTLAFVQEALDSSVRTTEDAERLVNAPALAVIPAETDGHRRRQLPTGDVPKARSGRMVLAWRF